MKKYFGKIQNLLLTIWNRIGLALIFGLLKFKKLKKCQYLAKIKANKSDSISYWAKLRFTSHFLPSEDIGAHYHNECKFCFEIEN
jgi:hypothetical protein